MAQKISALDLFMRHRNALLDYAQTLVGSRAQAEDLVQEAWLRFDKAERQHAGFENPLAYLYRIVRNLAFDARRQSKRERKLIRTSDETAAAQVDHTPGPEQTLISEDELLRVLKAMNELPERTRIALEMHRFEGRKLREIAAALNISISLAHILVADGLEHCKQRLEHK